MSAVLGVHLRISSTLMGSFGACSGTETRKQIFAALCEPVCLLISPQHSYGRLWITCPHPCLNCSNMLEVDQTERFAQPTELPLWAVGDQTWKQEKNKGLSGQLKDVWTTAAHQNLFSETSMKYPPSARSSQTCQTPLQSLRKCAVKARRFLHMKTLPNLCFLTGVNK